MRRRPMCLVCLLLMCCMCLADWLGIPLIRGNPLPEPVQEQLAQHPKVLICGEVQECRETEYSQSIYLKQVFVVQSEKIPIKNVRVFLKTKEEVPAGAFVFVSGKLERVKETRNPGEFDSRQYYACRHIYYFLKDGVIRSRSADYSYWREALLKLRERLSKSLEDAAGKDAPVFEAMLLGERDKLDETLKMKYQLAGIIHIMAISGLHISLLGMGLYTLLKKAGLGIFPAGIIALVLMVLYGVMTGASVSAMRAVCMFLLSIGAKILGRIYDPMTALALAAILLLLDAPAYLYSSSYLLSFGAVLGIGAAAPALCEMMGAKNKLFRSFLSSLAVNLTTLPVLLFFYGEVSVAGVLLNLAVLPTVGAVLASGAVCGIAGLFSVSAAGAAALPGRVLLAVYERLGTMTAGLPFCTWIGGRPEIWQIAVYYGILAGILLVQKYPDMLRDRTKGRKLKSSRRGGKDLKGSRFRRGGCIGMLCAGICILGCHPAKDLKITCLDVGQGDGIVVETPGGGHYLIDCGSSSQEKVGRYQLLPYLKSQGISYLDGIFVSHTDTDHISGIRELLELAGEGLTSVRAGALILPCWSETTPAYKELEGLAVSAGVKVRRAGAGDILQAGGLRFAILAPERGASGTDVNEDGMVIEITYGGFCGLFTGDIGEKTERHLLGKLSDIDFLKVAHHGSRYSSCGEFLKAVRPEIGIVSCSSSNIYGHPSPETVQRLKEAGCRVEYTMKCGAVSVITDGTGVWLEEYIAE